MRILIAGGGTGGHFYPALAVMEELSRRMSKAKLAYIGTRRGIEARILLSYPQIHFYPIHAHGLQRGHPLQNLYALLVLVVALLESLVILLDFRPQVIIGMGGYASFPAVLLGSLLKKVFPVRTVIHEQNAVAGLTNRLLSPFVDKVLVSYPQTTRIFTWARRTVVTGNPIRKEFLLAKRSEALYHKFDLDSQRRTVLVFGGSHGSAALTTAVLRAKALIAQNRGIQVLLVTGNTGEEQAIRNELRQAGVENVVVRRYIDRMGEAFALADLIVSRAGATTLAEITSCGKPALLIPWGGAANGHQWKNARVLEEEEACTLAKEKEILEQGLAKLIAQMLDDQERLTRLAKNSLRLGQQRATASILSEITALAREART